MTAMKSGCEPPKKENLNVPGTLEWKTELAFRKINDIIYEQARISSKWRNTYILDLKEGRFESFEDIATYVYNASKAILKPLESIPEVWLSAFEDEGNEK